MHSRPIDPPKLPDDTAVLTYEFETSRFWLEVLKPYLQYEIRNAQQITDDSSDPMQCFKWHNYTWGLRRFLEEYLQAWKQYDPGEEDDKPSDAPVYG